MGKKTDAENIIKNDAERLNKERDERVFPVVKHYFDLIGKTKDLQVGLTDGEKIFKAYNPIAQEVMKAAMANDLSLNEFAYLAQVVQGVTEGINSILSESLNKHVVTLQEKDYGSRINEMKLTDLHDRLRS